MQNPTYQEFYQAIVAKNFTRAYELIDTYEPGTIDANTLVEVQGHGKVSLLWWTLYCTPAQNATIIPLDQINRIQQITDENVRNSTLLHFFHSEDRILALKLLAKLIEKATPNLDLNIEPEQGTERGKNVLALADEKLIGKIIEKLLAKVPLGSSINIKIPISINLCTACECSNTITSLEVYSPLDPNNGQAPQIRKLIQLLQEHPTLKAVNLHGDNVNSQIQQTFNALAAQNVGKTLYCEAKIELEAYKAFMGNDNNISDEGISEEFNRSMVLRLNDAIKKAHTAYKEHRHPLAQAALGELYLALIDTLNRLTDFQSILNLLDEQALAEVNSAHYGAIQLEVGNMLQGLLINPDCTQPERDNYAHYAISYFLKAKAYMDMHPQFTTHHDVNSLLYEMIYTLTRGEGLRDNRPLVDTAKRYEEILDLLLKSMAKLSTLSPEQLIITFKEKAMFAKKQIQLEQENAALRREIAALRQDKGKLTTILDKEPLAENNVPTHSASMPIQSNSPMTTMSLFASLPSSSTDQCVTSATHFSDNSHKHPRSHDVHNFTATKKRK